MSETIMVTDNTATGAIGVTEQQIVIEVAGTGPQGPPGPQGDPGPPGVGSDKHYEQSFNLTSSVTVTHNLGKFPAVTVIDSANDEVVGDVTYIDNNQLIVSFGGAFSGKIICN